MEELAAVVSLGCAKNLVDSESMVSQLVDLGYRMTSEASSASLIVVNTCGFLQKAVEEGIEAVLQAAELKTAGSCRFLIAAGCMVQRYGKKLIEPLPEVDLFLGTSEVHRLKEILDARLNGESKRLWISRPGNLADASSPRLRSTPLHSAYVKIAEGCGNRCSFCLIPKLRGPYRSRTVQDVFEEVVQLCKEGVKEINLIAQDTTAFGRDRGESNALVRLLESFESVASLEWVRLLYAYPDRISSDLLRAMARSSKVVPYLDMPLQHNDPRILGAMGRTGASTQVEKTIDLIRSRIPEIALRTTLMVGFPGETAAEFEALVRFVEWAQFDHLGVFAFSPEPGTRAAKLPMDVSDEIKNERRHLLLEVQRDISRRRLQRWVGKVLPVLIEGPHPETELLLTGRLAAQAPEVDGAVIITSGYGDPGEIKLARITHAHDYDLEAELLEPAQPQASAKRPSKEPAKKHEFLLSRL